VFDGFLISQNENDYRTYCGSAIQSLNEICLTVFLILKSVWADDMVNVMDGFQNSHWKFT